MKLNNTQYISIGIFTLLFAVLYFGCDTKSSEQQELVKTRSQNLELINIDSRIKKAKDALNGEALYYYSELEHALENKSEDSTVIDILEAKASFWYKNNKPLLSGHFAKQIAEKLESDDGAWAICGTTFAIASKALTEEQEITYAVDNSRKAFENAISINPDETDYKINLALSFVDHPGEGGPMKGILMLLDLNKAEPENAAVLFQLGRLALGTNQLEKAVERLGKVVEIEPEKIEAHCMLAEALGKLGRNDEAKKHIEVCNS